MSAVARGATAAVPTSHPQPESLTGVASPPDALVPYSESDLDALELAKAERARADEREARAAERKVQADRERDHFTLTPNDDPQRDLL